MFGVYVLLCAIGLSPLARAGQTTPGAIATRADAAAGVVRETTDDLLAAVSRERAAVSEDPHVGYALVERYTSPFVDYDRIAKRVLGKHWRRASATQRRRFIGEFRALLVRTYATAITSIEGADVAYLPARADEKRNVVTVRTQVAQRVGSPISVDYRLYQKSGQWKVYDIVVGGVSLVLTHRSSFASQVGKVGLDGLIEHLAAMNEPAG